MSRTKTYEWAALLAPLLFAGCASPAVGLECIPGWEVCDGECVDPSFDTMNCGACGVVCSLGQRCAAGTCTETGEDAGVPSDGGAGDAAPSDASRPDATPSDTEAGSTDAAAPSGCGLGELRCGGACQNVVNDRTHCGECGHACGAGEYCIEGMCALACDSPRTVCGETCVHTMSDPANCGACDHVCAEGRCVLGACEVEQAGHIVVIGHDFTASTPSMDRLAGNAVFLARRSEPRVLVLEEWSTPRSVTGVVGAIDALGRPWTRQTGSAARLTAQLALTDVLVVPPQTDASDTQLHDLGSDSAWALREFTRGGGVVVLFDAMTARNAGTHRFLEGAGMFPGSPMSSSPSPVLEVVSAGDAICVGVPQRYRASGSTVRYGGLDFGVVVTDDVGAVAVHRAVYR